jgi:hypothetical protein
MSNKYQKGKIYKIVCKVTNKIYVGGTCEKYLSDRLKGHRLAYKYKKDVPNYYCSVFEVLKNNDYYIELIENYPCTCKDELSRRERHYIETLENVVNIKRPRVENIEKKEEFEKTIEKIICDKCDKCIQRRSLQSHYKSKLCILSSQLKNNDVYTIEPVINTSPLESDNESNNETDDDDVPPQGLLHLLI